MNDNLESNQINNNKKLIIIISLIAVICIGAFVYFKFIKTNGKNGDFLMAIEDVYYITGTGTVVTGKIERGTINLNDSVQIIGLNNETKTTIVTKIEGMSRQSLDTACAGDNVGLVLKNTERDEVERGQVVAKPNSISAITKFTAKVYVNTEKEGGRKKPFYNGYRPQFHFRTEDITGKIQLLNNIELVNPGDTAEITVELISPVAMKVGDKFSFTEGGATIGSGKVTKIYLE